MISEVAGALGGNLCGLVDRDELARRLLALEKPGDRLAYKDVAIVLGVDHWRAASSSAALRGAIEAVEHEHAIVLVRDPAIGVRLGTEADRVARNAERAAKAEGIARRGLEDLARSKVDLLDDEGRLQRLSRMTQLGAVQSVAAPEAFKTIVASQGALPGKEALKLFSRT